MKMSRFAIALFAAAAAFSASANPIRKTIVVSPGQQVVHTAQTQIATVNTPAGTNEGANQLVSFNFQQYDTNVLIRGVKLGETKLLIEGTDQRIGEVVTAIVVEPAVADRYRSVVGALAGIEGLSESTIHVAGRQVLVGGTVYSLADLNRCNALETQAPAATPAPAPARRGKKKASPPPAAATVTCLASLSSAAPVVYPANGYVAHVSMQLEESVPGAGAVSEAAERQSSWNATVRLGDVPVFSLAARDRAALLSRVGDFARRLEKALAEWQQQAEQGKIYPSTFQVRNAGGAYELGMTWKYDQGRFGEALIRISPEELQAASMRSGGGSDRLVQWWASLLHDAFRLYFMAMRPARTGDALAALYQSGVRVSPAAFDRSNSAVALARGYFALKASTGKDPFAELLIRPTASFQPPAIGS